jgi:ubiquinone/menaquinone biosynthesis C-methylase UbiE
MNITTKQWTNWWNERQIDWKTAYLDTWNHPHRNMIVEALASFRWFSLLEIGCGPGANLVNIVKHFKDVQLGGIDINKDAIDLARQYLNGALLKVGSSEDIMMSDNSVDVVLTDMSLIYVDPFKIKKVLKEIKRVGRGYVVFSELASDNYWEQGKLFFESGLHAHNYKKLLEENGFYDILKIKIMPEDWPNSVKQQKYGYIILAKIPKRK